MMNYWWSLLLSQIMSTGFHQLLFFNNNYFQRLYYIHVFSTLGIPFSLKLSDRRIATNWACNWGKFRIMVLTAEECTGWAVRFFCSCTCYSYLAAVSVTSFSTNHVETYHDDMCLTRSVLRIWGRLGLSYLK